MVRKINKGILVLTKRGIILAEKLRSCYEPFRQADIFQPINLHNEEGQLINDYNLYNYQGSLSEQVGKMFSKYTQLVFIMALGIVVRVIAPYLKDKRSDPAVITIDEAGRNIISTLSGHLGGANRLAVEIASSLRGKPVVTTATDVQGKIAFDLLAQALNCQIIPFKNLKLANSAVVNDRLVNIFTKQPKVVAEVFHELSAKKIQIYPLRELKNHPHGFPVIISNRQLEYLANKNYLQLVPKNLVIGLGCKRGVSEKQIADAVQYALKKLNLKTESIKKLATIDLKSDEEAIMQYARRLGIKVDIVKREQIKEVDFAYQKSIFVEKTIGVGGVCEPAALLSANQGRLLLGKTIFNQVTIAVVEESGETDVYP